MLNRSDKFKILSAAIVTFGTLITALILFYSYERKDLAEIAAILGILLGINTLALILSFTIDITEKSSELENTITENINKVQEVNEILDLYTRISDEDFSKLKEIALLNARDTLTEITLKRIEIKEESTYYDWLCSQMRKLIKDQNVQAVSVMAEYLWIDTKQEKEFYNENVEAKAREVIVSRIFITNHDKLISSKNREIIITHLADGLNAYICWEENISSELLEFIGEIGFIIFDGKLVLIDTNIQPAQGIASKKDIDLINFNDTFRKLKLVAEDAYSVLNRFLNELNINYKKKYTNIKKLKASVKEKKDKNLQLDLDIWYGVISDINKLENISRGG